MTWESAFEEFSRKSKVALRLAARWVLNTPVDKAYLFSKWLDACLEIGDFVSPELVYEDVLRKHPDFDDSWLIIPSYEDYED